MPTTQRTSGLQAGRKQTILAIDDAPIILEFWASTLSGEYQVLTATDGPGALAICAQSVPDLILLDIDLPGIDGYEVCRRIKAIPATADVPVIVVTAHEEASFETSAFQAGAVDFLHKPINIAVAKARIRSQIMLGTAVQELLKFNENLEARVAQRTKELEQALTDLRATQSDLLRWQAKATLTTLVASVSHDLGTPIGNAQIAASSTQTRLQRCMGMLDQDGPPIEEIKGVLDVALRNSALVERNLERAANLLLNFHHVAVDQVSESRRKFNLKAVVEETVHSLTPSLRRLPHKIALAIDPNIEMDSRPGALSQVLINLINNAFIHAFDDSREGLLQIVASKLGEYVDLEVSDNGAGIDPDILKRIFDPFYTTRGNAGGSGLGLAIAKGQVSEVLKGTVSVVSELGAGTKFRLVLPLTLEEDVAAAGS